MDEAKKDIIPIDALFGAGVEPNSEHDPRPMLHEAQVVFGHDWDSGRDFLVYGRSTLERIVRDNAPQELAVVRIGLDQETDELEKLLALMVTVKGRHDYLAGQ